MDDGKLTTTLGEEAERETIKPGKDPGEQECREGWADKGNGGSSPMLGNSECQSNRMST